MSKVRKFLLFLAFTLTITVFVGCESANLGNKSNVKEVNCNDLLLEPDYENAKYRPELGILFYETNEKIGLETSFGFFIYDYNVDKLEVAFKVDNEKAFGKDFFSGSRMSKDEKSILISGFSHVEIFEKHHYRYDIESGNLYRVEGNFNEEELYPLPDQNRSAFETNDWTAEDFRYYPPGSDTPYYPFKNLSLNNTEINKSLNTPYKVYLQGLYILLS